MSPLIQYISSGKPHPDQPSNASGEEEAISIAEVGLNSLQPREGDDPPCLPDSYRIINPETGAEVASGGHSGNDSKT
jgi:hypothetical protein